MSSTIAEKLREPPDTDHPLRKTDRCGGVVKGTSVVTTKATVVWETGSDVEAMLPRGWC